MDFSIIVCTYNGSQTIIECLMSLMNLDYLNKKYEVIIVDNNSKDNTSMLVIDFIKKNQLKNFKIIEELKPGKSFAFEKGFNSCTGNYIVTCDDDNFLDKDYLTVAKNIFNSNNQIGVMGGFGELISDVKIPDWVPSFQRYYACGAQYYKSGDVTNEGALWGAGMIFDANVFRNIRNSGFRNILTCRKGEELTSGGDIEYCRWFKLVKKNLWYEPKLRYKHFIQNKRLNVEYIYRLEASFDLVSEKMFKYDSVLKNKKINFFKALIYFVKNLLNIEKGFTNVLLQISFFGKLFTFDRETKNIIKALKHYNNKYENSSSY